MPAPHLPTPDPSCPFCAIASTYPPVAPSCSMIDSRQPKSTSDTTPPDPLDPEKTFPPSYVVLSTPDVIAFLDIAPLTRGHILLATRRHRVKTVELTTAEGAEVCTVRYSSPLAFHVLTLPNLCTLNSVHFGVHAPVERNHVSNKILNAPNHSQHTHSSAASSPYSRAPSFAPSSPTSTRQKLTTTLSKTMVCHHFKTWHFLKSTLSHFDSPKSYSQQIPSHHSSSPFLLAAQLYSIPRLPKLH